MENNTMELSFKTRPENEAFARMVICAFLMQKNPSLNIMSEVRTAVSEAVTNAIVHSGSKTAILRAEYIEDKIQIEVEDYGCGIENIDLAMQPFYTSKPEQERTGIGFALMQSFMDGVKVSSSLGCGTVVTMVKRLDA